MILITSGGRDYYLTNEDYDFLNDLYSKQKRLGDSIRRVITGGCRGADTDVESWASMKFITTSVDFWIPQWVWDELGKSAGPRRNARMMKYGKEIGAKVIIFPGGSGTYNAYKEASLNKLDISFSPTVDPSVFE